jgi:hypothetical protein
VVADTVAANLPGAALGVLVLAAIVFRAGIGHLHEVCLTVSLVITVVDNGRRSAGYESIVISCNILNHLTRLLFSHTT